MKSKSKFEYTEIGPTPEDWNTNLTLRNWMIGMHIAEYELNGEDRGRYRDKLFRMLAEILMGMIEFGVSALTGAGTGRWQGDEKSDETKKEC